jgi:hypothetical protein
MIQPNTENLFGLYDKIPVHQISTIRNPVKGLWEDTTLSKVFFSKENTSIIQNGIRAGVYKLSNGKYLVDNQDPEQLQLIMRGIFTEYSKNQPNNIREQVESLNEKVVGYCSDKVFQEAQGYLKYLRDSNSAPDPLTYPTLTSRSKQLEFKNFF